MAHIVAYFRCLVRQRAFSARKGRLFSSVIVWCKPIADTNCLLQIRVHIFAYFFRYYGHSLHQPYWFVYECVHCGIKPWWQFIWCILSVCSQNYCRLSCHLWLVSSSLKILSKLVSIFSIYFLVEPVSFCLCVFRKNVYILYSSAFEDYIACGVKRLWCSAMAPCKAEPVYALYVIGFKTFLFCI